MKRQWTDEEIEILKKYYPLIGDRISIEELCDILNRTQNSIYAKAQSMGLKQAQINRINYDLLEQLEKRITI